MDLGLWAWAFGLWALFFGSSRDQRSKPKGQKAQDQSPKTKEKKTNLQTFRQKRILPLEFQLIMFPNHPPNKLLLTVPLLRCAS